MVIPEFEVPLSEMDKHRLSSIRERLVCEREALGTTVWDGHPIPAYINHFTADQGWGGYSRVPPAAAAQAEAIVALGGRSLLGRYHRCVLLSLIESHLRSPDAPAYPADVQAAVLAHMHSIDAQMERQPPEFYLLGNDRFAKDFAVCRHKLVPCGAQLVDVRSGVPRRVVASQQGLGSLRMLGFMLDKVGGFRNLYEMHMVPRLILEFNPPGWSRCLMRIASLMERNSGVLAFSGSVGGSIRHWPG